MKARIEISDELFRRVKRLAEVEGATFKALVEEGLRLVLDERKCASGFRLRKASFKGNGLQPETRGMSWRQIRDLSYKTEGT